MPLKAPFPWFGGKSLAADVVWKYLGNTKNYVEPFFGSGAVLLNRADYDPFFHTETVNDKDCYLANFWRALQADPEQVAHWCDRSVNETDLHAIHRWLVNQTEFHEKMLLDVEFFDAKIAGYWVWGLCAWVGSGWCEGVSKQRPVRGKYRKLNEWGVLNQKAGGMGIYFKRPHLGNNGVGVHRQSSHLGNGKEFDLYEYFELLADRLRRVRVCCGDWSRVLTPAVTDFHGVTGILLDPPYDSALRKAGLYSTESDVSAQVREWAIANGENPKLRIALCGYENEHSMPDDWLCVPWKAKDGYSTQRRDKSNRNPHKERIWFSPHCLAAPKPKDQLSLIEH